MHLVKKGHHHGILKSFHNPVNLETTLTKPKTKQDSPLSSQLGDMS